MPMEAKFSDWILIYENILSETKKQVHEIFRESEREGEKEFNDGWLMQAAGRVKC